MLKLRVLVKGNDGIGAGTFYDLILEGAQDQQGQQTPLGSYTSYANAKTQAAAIFKASLSWDDVARTSAIFTT